MAQQQHPTTTAHQAQVHNIIARKRELPTLPACINDFGLEDAGTTDALALLKDPGVSLYCFDIAKNDAVFVRCPSDYDLTKEVPFLYTAQFDNAQMVYTIPIDTLSKLIPLLPSIDESKLIFLFNIGRCGSTLVSKMLEQMPGVVSLSEPDFVFLNFYGLTQERIALLIELGTRLLCRPIGPSSSSLSHHNTFYAFKFRSQATDFVSHFAKIFPKSRRMFLYRDAESNFISCSIAYSYFTSPFYKNLPAFLSAHALRIAIDAGYKDSLDVTNCIDATAIGWQSMLIDIKDRLDAGEEMLCFRYEELITSTQVVLNRIAEFCRLPPPDYERMREVMAEDSQEGSILSREELIAHKDVNMPTPQHLERFRQVLAMHPVVNRSNFLLPCTVVLQ